MPVGQVHVQRVVPGIDVPITIETAGPQGGMRRGGEGRDQRQDDKAKYCTLVSPVNRGECAPLSGGVKLRLGAMSSGHAIRAVCRARCGHWRAACPHGLAGSVVTVLTITFLSRVDSAKAAGFYCGAPQAVDKHQEGGKTNDTGTCDSRTSPHVTAPRAEWLLGLMQQRRAAGCPRWQRRRGDTAPEMAVDAAADAQGQPLLAAPAGAKITTAVNTPADRLAPARKP
jgi:hypothetical protein